ncbi:putative DNA-binding transcriptional regulator YafY [Acetoanaerobium pronyense]|uniref:DNA-binding transcriptional regulator YafY n=1 Tax=Acetoanaerobium pronyense TaxID=1482736 RepID=A0ABS4KGE5_9FIRM|nr:putative DNA-binding transcriptional regulator YafY [Acetoanaerobium pronyense]
MSANERRMKIIEVLCIRRQDTMSNLAAEFKVSIGTIRNDINALSLSYPLETIRGRYCGGVRVMKGYHLNRKYLKPQQYELLERLSKKLYGNDLAVMQSIFKDFVLNKNTG